MYNQISQDELMATKNTFPLSYSIFRSYFIIAVLIILVVGGVAFYANQEHKTQTIKNNGLTQLHIANKFLQTKLEYRKQDLAKIINVTQQSKEKYSQLQRELDSRVKFLNTSYIELVDQNGKKTIFAGEIPDITSALTNQAVSTTPKVLEQMKNAQDIVDIVSINNQNYFQVAQPIKLDKTGNATNYLFIYEKISPELLYTLEKLTDVKVNVMTPEAFNGSYQANTTTNSNQTTTSQLPFALPINIPQTIVSSNLPIQLIEKDADGVQVMVNYGPVFNDNKNIIGYLVTYDYNLTPNEAPFFILFLSIATALAFIVILIGAYNTRKVNTPLNAIHNACAKVLVGTIDSLEGITKAWETYQGQKRLGAIYYQIQNVIALVGQLKQKIENSSREKNALLLDFTESKDIIQKLTHDKDLAEQNYEQIFDDAPQGLFHINANGELIRVNKSFSALLGYDNPEQLISETQSLSRHLYSGIKEWELIRTNLQNTSLYINTINLLRKNQEPIHVNIIIKIKGQNSTNNQTVYEGSITDLSEKMRMRELENKCKVADSASTAKSQFLARMSHEIRTPLNAIIGMAELLSETRLNEEQTEYNSILKNAGTNLLGVINEILDFSKIESGKLQLEKIAVDLKELIKDIQQQFSLLTSNKGLNFIVNIDPNLPQKVACDPLRLRQIINNLLANALKFTSVGNITLDVKLDTNAPKEIGASTVIFTISDTGIGIPQNRQAQVFEDFTQADASTARQFGGSGLGLSICKILIDMMGGNISLSSEEQKGTCIQVVLRLENLPDTLEDGSKMIPELALQNTNENKYSSNIQTEVTQTIGVPINTLASPNIPPSNSASNFDQQPQIRYETPPLKQEAKLPEYLASLFTADTDFNTDYGQTAATERTAPLKILHVEDNLNNRQIFSLYLRSTNHMLVEAHNGAEAIEAFKHHTFDVIFMDIEMPIMDGYQATRILRAMEQEQGLPQTPILAITAHVLPEARERMFMAGCNDFIPKPYHKAEILKMIDKYSSYKQQ
ncbi:ATP-binding protein [Desulfovibrio litoralis]|uniref:Sensory/regulatory protein RpfC n=1 Tax=Desulfovibrio litoralis DSM 11393 TaxID=1121455 RepID=A0A1M7T5J3_9BACT|nr:ATP-binding protein [Desulfovibrio litoralis]SHN65991.1 PAS domain S-box-containing protein [Desulfovibrio litoralis DSM 11393]